MAPTIFALGLSGYIGGYVITHLLAKRPEHHIRAMVRALKHASPIKSQFPSLELVEGSLDLRSENRRRGPPNGRRGLLSRYFALIKGLAEGRKRTYIHVSGAANLIDFSLPFDVATPTLARDSDGAAVITSLPHDRIHAAFEQKIISEGERLGIKTAIVSQPQVHGKGRGAKKYGYSLYLDAVVKHGKAFVVNEGENIWAQSHVSDLSSAIEVLVDSALSSSAPVLGKPAAGWGKDGYYFLEAEELPFSLQADTVARAFQKAGLVETSEIDHLGPEEVGKFHQYALFMWGSSSRPRAQKLRALGWEPVGTEEGEYAGG
jgi:hypothetical protein